MSTCICQWPLNVNQYLCSCRAFHLELACTNVRVGLEHKVRFIAGYCAQCEDLLKLELFLEERRVQRWRIMGKLVRGCAFHPKYRLPSSFLSFLCLFMSRLSVQFLFCSFIWDWRGGFSFSKAVFFAGELWHACSGWPKLSEQSLLVSAPCPGGRPYPDYPLLAHCRPGSRLVCWWVGGAVTPQRALDLRDVILHTWLKGVGLLSAGNASLILFFCRIVDPCGL